MRFLVIAQLPIESGNEMIKQGKLPNVIQSIMEYIKPEAVYFGLKNGNRTTYAIINMTDASQIPKMLEPFFVGLDCSIELIPLMVAEDLAKAAPDIEAVTKNFGSLLN